LDKHQQGSSKVGWDGRCNCDTDENKGLCATYGIQGFPTIKVFSAGVKGIIPLAGMEKPRVGPLGFLG